MRFDDLPQAVEEVRQTLARLLEVTARDSSETRLTQEWYTLRDACELKGISYEVMRKRPRRYWPARGNGHPVVNNRGHYSDMYHRSEVLAWLPLTEPEIDEQIAKEVRA
ncbi:MAG: hypothetical protein ACLFS5_01940 [Spirochaetaceae bacterium]